MHLPVPQLDLIKSAEVTFLEHRIRRLEAELWAERRRRGALTDTADGEFTAVRDLDPITLAYGSTTLKLGSLVSVRRDPGHLGYHVTAKSVWSPDRDEHFRLGYYMQPLTKLTKRQLLNYLGEVHYKAIQQIAAAFSSKESEE